MNLGNYQSQSILKNDKMWSICLLPLCGIGTAFLNIILISYHIYITVKQLMFQLQLNFQDRYRVETRYNMSGQGLHKSNLGRSHDHLLLQVRPHLRTHMSSQVGSHLKSTLFAYFVCLNSISQVRDLPNLHVKFLMRYR